MSDHTIVDILDPTTATNFGGSLIGRNRSALSTGFPAWDKACDETGGRGLGNWWYVVIGGASNAGKTRLMLHLCRQATEQSFDPGLITMEVPREGIQRSMYSNVTDFGYYDFLPHHWEDDTHESPVEKMHRLGKEVGEYSQGQISFKVAEFKRAPTLSQIIDACHQMKAMGSKVIFLDHLQLIKSDNAREIVDRATEVSEALRWFAHTEKVLVVALSQLNRLAARERSQSPNMHDLWGGTAIESNSNQVVVLDHTRVDRPASSKLRTWINLDKNREGPAKIEIPVEADFRTGVWREAFADESSDWPEHGGKGR